MRVRILEQLWEAASRYVVQEHVEGDLWRWVRDFANEQAARDFMALYAAGPRVVVDSGPPCDDPLQQNDFSANALQ